ncbi:MAG TPA: hypothetical protein DD491_14375 [Halieaceae bacterium]|nr:hypothetical protein [Halieaceae bacterium]
MRLARGEFAVSGVEIYDFYGTLQGAGRSSTVLNLYPNGVSCGTERQTPLTFRRGDFKIKYLTIRALSTCQGTDNSYTAIALYGRPKGAGCDPDVLFARFERITMETDEQEGENRITAVRAGAEAAFTLDGCSRFLLGKLDVWRSTFRGFNRVIAARMQGHATVDISNNRFENCTNAFNTDLASQDTSIVGNYFGPDAESRSRRSVAIAHGRARNFDPNDIRVERNTFILNQGGSAFTTVGRAEDITPRQSAITIANNLIEIEQSAGPTSVAVINIDAYNGGVIKNNLMTGTAARNGVLFSGARMIDGWLIDGNDFGGNPIRFDPYIGVTIGDNFIGEDQNTTVIYEGF